MIEKKKYLLLRILLPICTVAMILYTVPAWIPGMCAAAVICVVLAVGILRKTDAAAWFQKMRQHPNVAAISFLWTVAYGFNFYNMWLDSSYVARLAALVGLNSKTIVAAATVCLGMLAFVGAAWVVVYLAEGISAAFMSLNKAKDSCCKNSIPAAKAFVLLSVIYVVGIFAIIQADFLYQDDAARAFYGYKQWDYFARFLSTAAASLIHGGDYLVDIAPLPQILAMVIMALSGILALVVLYDRTEFSLMEVLSMIPLGLNPYFLECVSFRFDAPYMAISVLGGIAPLLFYKQKNTQYILASILGTIAVCTSYQPATGIYPVFVILIALRMWCRGDSFRNTVTFCVKSVTGYGLGLVYFKMVLMRPASAGYVSNSLPPASELLSNTMGNLAQYYKLIGSDFKLLWLGLIGLLVIFFVLRMIVSSRQAKVQSVVMTLAALLLMLLLAFGIYPVLANTLMAPRAMYGFGVLLALLCAVVAEGKICVCRKLSVLLLGWVFFVFAFHYGNALGYQREYTDFRMNLVLEDLQHQQEFLGDSPVKVQLTGSIGQAPLLRNLPQNYQMLNRLIPQTFGGGSDLTQYRFFCYHDLRNVIWDQSETVASDLPLVLDTMYHTIYGNGEQYVIALK